MSVPNYESDDLFILAPSTVLSLSGKIEEGKALATVAQQDLMLLQNVGKLRTFDAIEVGHDRKVGVTVGRRKLRKVQEETRTDIARFIHQFYRHKLTESQFRKKVRNRMKESWRDVFLAGLRAGGATGTGQGAKAPMVILGPGDDKWLKTAMTHETRYLNGFLTAVVEESGTMSLDRRLGMYIDTMESFFDSARVIALPAQSLIYWVGPGDKRTCPGCRYMFERGPFTKFNLPTTPRAGVTACISNCRDRLFVRSAPLKEITERESEMPDRDAMLARLKRIKLAGY
jgi:hypothetical protein